MEPVKLQKYVIDVCSPVTSEDGKIGVQMKSWIIMTENPTEAIQKYIDEGSNEVYFEGEVVEHIIVGLQPID